MPLYDYGCTECDNVVEVFHRIDELVRFMCTTCRVPMQKLMTIGGVKRPDASWIASINGTINDLADARTGKQEFIETREQARAAINKTYSDPHPRVQALRKRYLERY